MARRALLSVSDKGGIVELGRALSERGWEILSTGGTAARLQEAGIEVKEVAQITGHPEMMSGRVKTLHPAVHAGILARRDNPADMADLEAQGYGAIDLVAVNLYAFREAVADPDVTKDKAMSKVDIGGPTMIRAAAKNHRFVWVVVDPGDYQRVVQAIEAEGDQAAPDDPLRLELATKVFEHVSDYDGAITDFLGGLGTGEGEDESEVLPGVLDLNLSRLDTLRYGENPDQAAAFYTYGDARVGLTSLEQHHGKDLSYNNYLDLDGALLALSPFALSPRPAVCIVKHTTPCGLAMGDSLVQAYQAALRTDSTSAFGSVIALSRAVDADTAEALSQLFVECIVAPQFTDDATEILTQKKNLRLITFPQGGELPPGVDGGSWWDAATPDARSAAAFLLQHGRLPTALTVRSVSGGILAQTPPAPPLYGSAGGDWSVVTTRQPSESEMDDLRFAWAAVFGVKSNAILFAKDGATLGIGAGQMSRVDASKIAVRKAGDAGLDLNGSALASDAFFPFRDGVDAAADAGVSAIVQPGGSIRDEEVIGAADEHGMTMVFTGRRLFRH